jgi:hypothetical protein
MAAGGVTELGAERAIGFGDPARADPAPVVRGVTFARRKRRIDHVLEPLWPRKNTVRLCRGGLVPSVTRSLHTFGRGGMRGGSMTWMRVRGDANGRRRHGGWREVAVRSRVEQPRRRGSRLHHGGWRGVAVRSRVEQPRRRGSRLHGGWRGVAVRSRVQQPLRQGSRHHGS